MSAFICSMEHWKTHTAIGTKASGHFMPKPNRFCQHDLPTTLHTHHNMRGYAEHLPLAKYYAERAMKHDPNLAEAHAIMGATVERLDWI